jgi:hypothetical protein
VGSQFLQDLNSGRKRVTLEDRGVRGMLVLLVLGIIGEIGLDRDFGPQRGDRRVVSYFSYPMK